MRIYEDNLHPTFKRSTRRVRPVSAVTKVKQSRFRKSYEKQQEHSSSHGQYKDQQAVYHFDDLELEVEELQEQLDEEKRPFNVFIYKKEKHVYIDIYRINTAGQRHLLATKDITHGNFTAWAKMIMEGEGMLFNEEG